MHRMFMTACTVVAAFCAACAATQTTPTVAPASAAVAPPASAVAGPVVPTAPAVMPAFVGRPLRARGIFAAAKAGWVATPARAARPSHATRRSRPAVSFFEKVEHELEKVGGPAGMTPTELAEHLDRIIVAPLGKLNLAQAAAMVRAAFHPPGVRAPRAVAPRPARSRQRRVRNRRHRVAGRGPRAPATVDAPPEPPTERHVAELRNSRQFGENPRLAVALATAPAEMAP